MQVGAVCNCPCVCCHDEHQWQCLFCAVLLSSSTTVGYLLPPGKLGILLVAPLVFCTAVESDAG